MPNRPMEQPDISLQALRQRMAFHGVRQLLVKELAANDNSKNQPYLGGDMSITNILPVGEVRAEVTVKGNESLKAPLPLWWLQPVDGIAPAPHAQLILYPQYPEVRLSGFLKGAQGAPSGLMNVRQAGRFLFLGITSEGQIIAWATSPDSTLAGQLRGLGELERTGIFSIVPMEASDDLSTRDRLLAELRRIHLLDWVDSRRFLGNGILIGCDAPQCVGYTLEAALGIIPNGRSEPDYLGWEIKASEVSAFGRPAPAKAITLMTPEPTGGYYRTGGVEAFIRKYGYVDKLGRVDRLNFGGVHRALSRHETTGLTLMLAGFDADKGRITNPTGSLALVDDAGNVAAEWSFASLMSIWNRKHAQAAYVPAEARSNLVRQYRYGSVVRMGEGTDIQRLLRAIAAGGVYYDPGIKLENASQARPAVKRRSQFRMSSRDIPSLYASMTDELLVP